MKSHLGLISTANEVEELALVLKDHPVIAFDTEFIRESTFFPIVELIQIATESESWIVDAQAFKKNHCLTDPQSYDPGLNPLLEIFTDRRILKVAHATQGDQECLYTSFGVVASPTFDTAVAASLCGYGEGIGLGKLLKLALDVNVTKGHARTNWSVRPLPQHLVEYAHSDVEHLVRLANKLLDGLDQLGRKKWALELSAKWEDKSLYETDIEGMAQKLARGGRLDPVGYGALLGLVKWREQRVRKLNLPRRWVADDHVLLDLAHVRPKDIAHLSTFRGINKGELKNSGEALLAAMREGMEGEAAHFPKNAKPEIPTTEESQVLEILRCYVSILADQHKIAAKHLMTASKLLPLLRCEMFKAEDLEKAGILSAEAARLIGNDLIALIQGKRALVIRGGRVQVVDVDAQE